MTPKVPSSCGTKTKPGVRRASSGILLNVPPETTCLFSAVVTAMSAVTASFVLLPVKSPPLMAMTAEEACVCISAFIQQESFIPGVLADLVRQDVLPGILKRLRELDA